MRGRMILQTKSAAYHRIVLPNEVTGLRRWGSRECHALPAIPAGPLVIGTAENCTRGQTHVICQNRTMTRNDVLVWLSLAGLFAAYCATFWVFFPLGD